MFKAHKLLYQSTLGLRVIKKKDNISTHTVDYGGFLVSKFRGLRDQICTK